MKKSFPYILLFFISTNFYTQEMIDLIFPETILEQGVTSVTQWNDGEKGVTVYYNSKGLPHYYYVNDFIVDSLNNVLSGDYGKITFDYDQNNRLIKKSFFCDNPFTDSIIFSSIIKYYYSNNLLVKKENYHNPILKPKVTRFIYKDSLLIQKISTVNEADLSLSGKTINKRDSVVYTYNESLKISKIQTYRDNDLHHYTLVNHYGNVSKYLHYENDILTSFNYAIYDEKGKVIERVYPERLVVKYIFDANGLLILIERYNLLTKMSSKTEFKYK